MCIMELSSPSWCFDRQLDVDIGSTLVFPAVAVQSNVSSQMNALI